MAAETEPGFEIGEKKYPIPSLDTFTLDEAQVLYDYSGLTLEDFTAALMVDNIDDLDEEDAEDFARKMRNPGLLRTLVHIAYQRGNPKLPSSHVRKVVGETNMMERWSDWLAASMSEEDEADPPALTSERDESSPSASLDSGPLPQSTSASSGSGSAISSDAPGSPPPPTTDTRSDTSSISLREISAA